MPARAGRDTGPTDLFPNSTGVDRNRTYQGLWVQPFNGFEDRGTHQASGHSQVLGDASMRRDVRQNAVFQVVLQGMQTA